MLHRYLVLVFARAFRLSLARTDVFSAVATALAPVAFWLSEREMPEHIALHISALASALVLTVIMLRLVCSPFFIWREDKKEIDHLKDIANSPDRREREFIAEERARRRFAASDEVTRIRTIFVNKSTSKEEKMQAFRGAQYHSDLFWHDAQFANCWEEFHEACSHVSENG